MSAPKKLSAERLAEIRRDMVDLCDHEYEDEPSYCYRCMLVEMDAHCDALAAENQVLREALEFYANPEEPHVPIKWLTNRARTALEKTK